MIVVLIIVASLNPTMLIAQEVLGSYSSKKEL
jgi:hypothetical protein